MVRRALAVSAVTIAPIASVAPADTAFLEAESFDVSSDGWRVSTNAQTRAASRAVTLNGATGPGDAVATKSIVIREAGRYRIWVRYLNHEEWRGPFRVAVSADGRELANEVFDLTAGRDAASWGYLWKSFETDLPAGEVVVRLSKYEEQNCSGYVRHVDCLLLTTDLDLQPDHMDYGPQTYLRVTVGDAYEQPIYIHVFADHFRAPWYAHFSISSAGLTSGIRPPEGTLLSGGAVTPWCNITPMLYQDSGAILNVTARYTYHDRADRLAATLEFATAPQENAVIRAIRADCRPNGLVIASPPDLTTPENIARLRIDKEVAEETGKIADAFPWPTHGRVPERFPFLVSAHIGGYGTPVDAAVTEREEKTLSYFGFTPDKNRVIGGLWHMKDGSYCRPDLDKMTETAATQAADFRAQGGSVEDIIYCMLMDEPTGQPTSFIANDAAYADAFREWLREMGLEPAELLVADWDAVRPVTDEQRDEYPALYYFTQRFRTRALGDFMATQRRILEEAYGGSFPTVVNFSDGAVYAANFYLQGVDYFELLDSDDQNAIWSEDWANLSSTFQCASYNVELMRAAARERGQTLGHYLIAYAGRKPWDIKLQATGEVARGVKMLMNFSYGPSWGSHEGGPSWASTQWYSRPETWSANAGIVREIGGAEDMLATAMPARAKVAILYSSSTDVWTLNSNYAYGFDRMHTWLALAHAQVPVDIISERQVAKGLLDDYQVCYLSGPNLSRAAAAGVKEWVEAGGTLWVTAGAAVRDEYNRPLSLLDDILPAERRDAEELQNHLSAGKFLHTLQPQDGVRWDEGAAEVLSVKQALAPRQDAEVLATFGDGSPAALRGPVGSGSVYCVGFLPALAYIKRAEVARNELQEGAEEAELLEQSYNPWEYPSDIRQFILTPVRAAGVESPIECSVPLVDAVYMTCDEGILIPLANYTLRAVEQLRLRVTVARPVARAESVVHGALAFDHVDPQRVEVSLPLDSNDFVKLYYR